MKKSLAEVHESVDTRQYTSKFKKILSFLGPAYLVSVGYMDPGNWATDIAGGSEFGYQLIWVLLLSNLMALLLQSLAARLGIVGGLDLAQASRQQYPNWVNWSLYGLAEIAIAATDLAEIIGMAIGLQLLFHLPLIWGVTITLFDTFLLLFLMNLGIRKMELFVIGLVSVIGISFLVQLLIVEPDVKQIALGFIPSELSGNALYIAIGIIGATVMPHNLYLHSSLVQTRRFSRDENGIKTALKFNLLDSTIALNAAFLVNAAILILAASAFYTNGIHRVTDISNAHEMLTNLFGSLAPTLFAIALIAAGQSSTVTGTLAGQIVMEGYLNLRISPWFRRIITRIVAVAPALFTLFYFGDQELGRLLILSQVVLSLQLAFAIVPLIHFTSSSKIMGTYANSKKVIWLSWLVALVIIGLNAKLVVEELTDFFASHEDLNGFGKFLIFLLLAYIVLLLLWIVFSPIYKRMENRQIIPHASLSGIELKTLAPYQKIGIAVDFGSKDTLGISHAINMGGKSASYVLIHIVESAAARQYTSQVEDQETQLDRDSLMLYAKELMNLGYQVKPCLGFGDRTKSIAKIVVDEECELLIMGAHGHHTLKDLLFGSTVDAVRHRLKIPVLVV